MVAYGGLWGYRPFGLWMAYRPTIGHQFCRQFRKNEIAQSLKQQKMKKLRDIRKIEWPMDGL